MVGVIGFPFLLRQDVADVARTELKGYGSLTFPWLARHGLIDSATPWLNPYHGQTTTEPHDRPLLGSQLTSTGTQVSRRITVMAITPGALRTNGRAASHAVR